jgi:pyrroloquinoline quinone biosynthesis protein B
MRDQGLVEGVVEPAYAVHSQNTADFFNFGRTQLVEIFFMVFIVVQSERKSSGQAFFITFMRVRLLGTAAGGGLPQWNCNCTNCRQARLSAGLVRPRTQSSVAISQDGRRWFLLNASPDLARQIEVFKPLQPTRFHPRGTPIQGVLLTNADLDHTLGLLSLREGPAFSIYASRETQAALSNHLGLLPVLQSFCPARVVRPATVDRRLRYADGSPSDLVYRAFPVPCKKPRFATTTKRGAIGYHIQDLKTGGRLIFVPEILTITAPLARFFNNCDLLLFDGTFWSNQEMAEQGITTRTAAEMGHVPLSGSEGSLEKLAGVTHPRKVYVHINNTNPILRENSPERRQTVKAGWRVGHDGMEFNI